MSVLARAHEMFSREELPPAENSHILVQLENRGAGVGITSNPEFSFGAAVSGTRS
jgi:hypothetical protein